MAGLKRSLWNRIVSGDTGDDFSDGSVQYLAFRLENRWRAANQNLGEYIDANAEDKAICGYSTHDIYTDSPILSSHQENAPAVDETIRGNCTPTALVLRLMNQLTYTLPLSVTTNKPPNAKNYALAVAHDLLQRELIFCQRMLTTTEILFGRRHRGRLIVTAVLACAKFIEVVAPRHSWDIPASKTRSGILWGLLATSVLITVLEPGVGKWLAWRCSSRISEVQALLRTRSLGEEHRYALATVEWAMTFRLLWVEALISDGKRYIRNMFKGRED
ncbi:hypothetical protein ABW21_db0208098 [Orbilia brochopaga]|nr:hypothetical protein ABW21_db0208098 [Drechslerella brochopaga]